MKRLTITEPTPGQLRLEVRDERGVALMDGTRFSLEQVLSFLDSQGVTPDESQLAAIQRALGAET